MGLAGRTRYAYANACRTDADVHDYSLAHVHRYPVAHRHSLAHIDGDAIAHPHCHPYHYPYCGADGGLDDWQRLAARGAVR